MKAVKVLLESALTSASQGTSQKTAAIAHLGNFHLAADSKKLTVSATNLEVFVAARCPVLSEGDSFVTTVPAEMFLELVRSIPDDILDISYAANELLVCGDKSKSRIKTIPPEDFPPVDFPKKGGGITLPAEELAKVLRRVVFAASDDPLQASSVLSGIYIENKGKKLTMVGVNGFHYSIASIPSKVEQEWRTIVPAKHLPVVAKSVSGNVSVQMADDRLVFLADSVNVGCLLLDGQFPDYRTFPTSKGEIVIAVSTAELASACRHAKIFAPKKGIIHWELSPMLLHISSEEDTGGSIISVPIAVLEGDARLDINFNVGYVLDLLSVVDTPTVNIRFDNPRTPAVFTMEGINATEFTHGILPMVVTEKKGKQTTEA